MSGQTTDALAEKLPATHIPKHLAGEVAVLEGAPARVALLAAAAVLLLLRLGALGVSAPDEPVYTEMAEEVRSRRTALLGAALLVTTPFFAHLGRRAALDVVLAMFELCA